MLSGGLAHGLPSQLLYSSLLFSFSSDLMFYLFTRPKCVAILALIVFGIASQKQTTAAPPELMNLYFAELNRSHCDHLVVAILQQTSDSTRSKRGLGGHVVSMFPPTNDGTRPKNSGGTGSDDAKSGAINHNSSRSNRGTRTDTGGGTGSGDAKSGAINHNSVRSNRGTRTDTGGGTGGSKPGAVNYSSVRSNRPSSTNTGGGDAASKSDVVQCEHCGASCTEPCRCNTSGIGLIFGATDDQIGMMQYEEDFTYITYKTSYGMRAVTLISMGPDSNQTLAIAKAWGGGDCNDGMRFVNPGKIVNSDGNELLDPNPYAEVGVAHNRTLDYLTPDLKLTLLNLRQGNDMRVRKKPGKRANIGNITLKRAHQNAPSDEELYLNSCLFMSHIYGVPADQFLPTSEVLTDGAKMADGYPYYQDVKKRISATEPVMRAFQYLEETILLSSDLTAFNRSVDQQVVETLKSRDLSEQEKLLVLGSLSLAKGTLAYWDANDDIFIGDIIERGNGKFWADLGGFLVGFTGTLINNNNNGGNPDQNAFTNGTAVAAGASAAVGDKDEP